MSRPVVSDLAELLYEELGFHKEDDAAMGEAQPAATNLATSPSGEAAAKFTNGVDFLVTREEETPAIPASVGEYRDKHTYDGSGTDTNDGFCAFGFPSAGIWTISLDTWLPSAWNGGKPTLSPEGYTSAAVKAQLQPDLAKRDQWQRISTTVEVAGGDLAGFIVLRSSAPSSPATGVFYTDALHIEAGTATDYFDGDQPGCSWNGTPHASTSTRAAVDTTWPLLKFCAGWVAPLETVYELVREHEDGTPSWGLLFDADRCPAACLPYLAQYVGVVITPEMTEEQIRNEIREPTGWKRGQTEAIRIALRRTLVAGIGTDVEPLVIIRPRTPEAGRHYIRTLKSQTPDPERTKAVLREKLPAWEALDYAAIEGVTVLDVASSAKWTTVADLAAAWPNVKALAEILPTDL